MMKLFMEYRLLKTYCESGDIVKIDVCAAYQGYFADMARTFFIEPVDQEVQKFVNVA